MFKYFLVFFIGVSSVNATRFDLVPWRKNPNVFTHVAVMEGAAANSTDYLADGHQGVSNVYALTSADTALKVPMLHAYNPYVSRYAAIELAPTQRKYFPANLPIPAAAVTTFFISIESRIDTETLNFKPQYAVDRSVPVYTKGSKYCKEVKVHAGVFALDGTQVQFTDLPGAGLKEAPVYVHASEDYDHVLSGDSMRLPNVQGNPSRAYYSIVSHTDDKSRVSVTLHWLINPIDDRAIKTCLDQSKTLKAFRANLSKCPLKATPEAMAVIALLTGVETKDSDESKGAIVQEVELPMDAIMQISFKINTSVLGHFWVESEGQKIPLLNDESPLLLTSGTFVTEFLLEANKKYKLCWGKENPSEVGEFVVEDIKVELN